MARLEETWTKPHRTAENFVANDVLLLCAPKERPNRALATAVVQRASRSYDLAKVLHPSSAIY